MSAVLLPIRRRTLLDCLKAAPDLTDTEGNRRWLIRTSNFVVEMTAVTGSAVFTRDSSPDEYMMVVPPGMQALSSAGGDEIASDGDALFIVPPGASSIRVSGNGLVVRVFSKLADDLASLACNREAYAEPLADAIDTLAWPGPTDGLRLRHYALAAHVDPNSISRVFRSTNLMLNIMKPYESPRDPRALMPHAHTDCEQITITLKGTFAHHLRTPWLPDSTQWRADEHIEVGSPSALVIPPRLIHTTQALEAGCLLIDVFGPPRFDFSRLPGLVRNASEYPMPQPA